MNKYLSTEASLALLHKLRAAAVTTVYNREKHRLAVEDGAGNALFDFRLPLVLPPPTEALQLPDTPVHYIILLIQAGNCAMGYFEDGHNLDHKVFRAYMVRKKQGKSQIKYLKTKGKSRAGSRVRLGETAEFFENINERLQQYFAAHEVHRIAISCSKTLLPFLYNARVATPFDKRDERLYKIPQHIHTPIYEVMMDANKFLQKGELIYDESRQGQVMEMLGSHHPSEED